MKNSKEILKEFVEATPKWFNQMKKMDFDSCMVCGMQPEKMMELCEAIKEELNLI